MYIDFDGKRYYLDKRTGYYRSHMRSPDREYLHRDLWKRQHGNIPHGWEVHHRDGNQANNLLGNLECLPAAEHSVQHHDQNADNGRRTIDLTRIRRTFVCENCGRAYQGVYRKVRRWCSKECANHFHNRRQH